MEQNGSARLLAVAAGLLLLAGCLFGCLHQWIYAALVGLGAFGCAAAARNLKKRKDQ